MSVADTANPKPEAQTEIVPFEPVLGDRFVLAWPHFMVTLWFAGLFLLLSHLPLFHTEVWGHVTVGNSILQSQSLVVEEPVLSLAEGMPFVNSAWLSQVIMAAADNIGGPFALSGLSAVSQVITLILFGVAVYLRTGKKRYVLAASVFAVIVSWGLLSVLRPQVFGGICFASLLLMVAMLPQWNCFASKSESKKGVMPLWFWIAVPLLFVLWVNLDISFVAGLAVLACLAVGRLIDVWRKTGSLLAPLLDQQTRSLFLLAELAALATLANPLGWNLWGYAVGTGANSFFKLAGGWRPLALASWVGVGFAAIWLVALLCLRSSKSPIRGYEILLMAVFSVAVACNALFIFWLPIVAGFVLLPRVHETLDSFGINSWAWVQWLEKSAIPAKASEGTSDKKPLRFAFTLCSVLVVWIAFALSPISTPLLGGGEKATVKYNSQTPVGAAKFLSENVPAKLVWAPSAWGDFLHRETDAKPGYFANSNIRILPPQAQLDYAQIHRAAPTTQRLLNRYDVGVVVVDVARQRDLNTTLNAATKDWRIAYEDEQAAIYVRRNDDSLSPRERVGVRARSPFDVAVSRRGTK